MNAEERLALVQLKIDRATRHIAEAQQHLRTFGASHPCAIEVEENRETGWTAFKVTRVDVIPPVIAASVGDAVHNLRSALDHVTQQLWLTNNPGRYNRKVAFPTGRDRREFERAAQRQTNGLRQDALDTIFAIEPYMRGKGGDLFILSELDNMDKHRLLVTVMLSFQYINFGPAMAAALQKNRQDLQPDQHLVPNFRLLFGGAEPPPLQVGNEVFKLAPGIEVDLDRDVTFEVALDEPGLVRGKPVLGTLQHFTEQVSNTVALFEPCLA
jgi:hypothetical protein